MKQQLNTHQCLVDEIVITQMDRSENKYDYVVNKKTASKQSRKEASELAL